MSSSLGKSRPLGNHSGPQAKQDGTSFSVPTPCKYSRRICKLRKKLLYKQEWSKSAELVTLSTLYSGPRELQWPCILMLSPLVAAFPKAPQELQR